MKEELYKQITEKKELSKLPRIDVEKAFSKFEKIEVSDREKVRLTRDLLNKIFWPFRSKKLLSLRDKPRDWILRKHLSSRERLKYYNAVYNRIFKGETSVSVIDLGCGVNGSSYSYFPCKVNYLGVEGVGQLVDLMNYFFKDMKYGKTVHMSLFELAELKKLIKSLSGKKIVFLFKVLDSLEMLERDYSKKLLKAIVPLVDRVVISYATKSMIKKVKFNVTRNWFVDFIKENFKIIDNFNIGNERYLIFK